MGKRILLDIAPNSVQHSVEVDENGFTYAEHQTDELEQVILDECAAARSLHQRKSNFQLAARVPIVTHAMWKKEWRQHHKDKVPWPQFLAAKLNSRDYCKLRTGHKDSAFGKKL